MAFDDPPPVDWPRLIRDHGRRAAIDLPQATVEELAQHLEDIAAAARAAGASPAQAHARAIRALEESALSGLRRQTLRAHSRAGDVGDRKSTRLNPVTVKSRMPSSA